jgi:hypothetical protein
VYQNHCILAAFWQFWQVLRPQRLRKLETGSRRHIRRCLITNAENEAQAVE